eukprot:m.54617 g.54617  ORF g.54617 m.54617 type:complete len:243 (+) comp13636_c0_seq3:118-846(+)
MDEGADDAYSTMVEVSSAGWQTFSAPTPPSFRSFDQPSSIYQGHHPSQPCYNHSSHDVAMHQRRGAGSPLSTTSSSSIASMAHDNRKRHESAAYVDLGTDDELELLHSKRAKYIPSPPATISGRSRSTDPANLRDSDLLGLGFERLVKTMSVPPGVMARHPSAASDSSPSLMQDDPDNFDLPLDRFSFPGQPFFPDQSSLDSPKARHSTWSTEPAGSPRPEAHGEPAEFVDMSPPSGSMGRL